MGKGYGDRLAKGGNKASFAAVEGTSADKWAEALGNFDPLAYLKKTEEEELERQASRAQKLIDEEAEDERERISRGNSDADATRNAWVDLGKTESNA